MCLEDGLVMDDGTTARMGEDHFIMTTTTMNAESVYRYLESLMPWPEMDVRLISTTVHGLKLQLLVQNLEKLCQIC